MLIYPAIDLISGNVVRLTEGDYDRETLYSRDPVAVAEGFVRDGATCLHAVDLDGARTGRPQNREVIRALCRLPLFVEVGGGMRSERAVMDTLELGADRVILGTVALTDFPLVRRLAASVGDRLAVGVDARDGRVATHGWKNVSARDSLDFCRELAAEGVSTVIYTDISRDGLLAGANLDAYAALADVPGLRVIASGGVSFEREIAVLRDAGLYGCIVGKALYAGALTLPRALALARGEADVC